MGVKKKKKGKKEAFVSKSDTLYKTNKNKKKEIESNWESSYKQKNKKINDFKRPNLLSKRTKQF